MIAEFANYRSWIDRVPIVSLLAMPLLFRRVPVSIDLPFMDGPERSAGCPSASVATEPTMAPSPLGPALG